MVISTSQQVLILQWVCVWAYGGFLRGISEFGSFVVLISSKSRGSSGVRDPDHVPLWYRFPKSSRFGILSGGGVNPTCKADATFSTICWGNFLRGTLIWGNLFWGHFSALLWRTFEAAFSILISSNFLNVVVEVIKWRLRQASDTSRAQSSIK